MSVPPTPGSPKNPTGVEHPPLAIQKNDFILSSAARGVRVLAEYEEFPYRLRQAGIRGTYLLFGSARSLTRKQYDDAVSQLEGRLAGQFQDAAEKVRLERKLAAVRRMEWMCEYMQMTQDLCKMLTEWSLSPEGVAVGRGVFSHFPSGNAAQPLIVCTGGGPGFMEAGNKGAAEVPNGTSMGVAITLPFESTINEYITEGLSFRTEWFFSRKFWEVYCAKAVICAPGGYGTCDEMFEVLTLLQCEHSRKVPVVLLGRKFWNEIINFKAFAELGVTSFEDIESLFFADDAQSAFDYIRTSLIAEAEERRRKDNSTPPTKK